MKRPWNIIDLPIYSLQTTDKKGSINMNICTYVTAISIKPKIYSIAIDYNTKTFENLEDSSEAILQIVVRHTQLESFVVYFMHSFNAS